MTIHEILPHKSPAMICVKNLYKNRGIPNSCRCPLCNYNIQQRIKVTDMPHRQGWILQHPDGRQEILRP